MLSNKKECVIISLVVSLLFTGISTSISHAEIRVIAPPGPIPSPSPGPSPTPVTYVAGSPSSVLATIQNSQIYNAGSNSQTVETVRTINDGLTGTGLVGAAVRAGRVAFTLAKAAFTLWLLAK